MNIFQIQAWQECGLTKQNNISRPPRHLYRAQVHDREEVFSFQYFIGQTETIHRAKIVKDRNRNLVSRPKRLGQKHGAYRGPSRCDARHVFKPNTV